ncbi:HAD-like domain-containing protein [Aspergillus ambiguus]|uniref:haloacid dehalogenase, type II n=1 Tax=Aspergillus ambiguus TaxID=176160 RepID=UPI003CCD7D0E
MATKCTVIAFDIYGTLLSYESISSELEIHFDRDKSRLIAQLWRRYQLEYTWRLVTMGSNIPAPDAFLRLTETGCYQSFREVTKNALVHALGDTESRLKTDEIDRLLRAYDSLATFHDVEPALERIAQIPNVAPVIFSNGTAEMLDNSIARSVVLSRHRSVFQDVITVDDIRKFKPAREVYEYLAQRVGKGPTELSDIWLVSGNPFDVIGALEVGLKAIWVDRARAGWKDQAMPSLQPTAVVHQLEEVAGVVQGQATA